jgi:hypothetical protein
LPPAAIWDVWQVAIKNIDGTFYKMMISTFKTISAYHQALHRFAGGKNFFDQANWSAKN